jgi:hypothetical protein
MSGEACWLKKWVRSVGTLLERSKSDMGFCSGLGKTLEAIATVLLHPRMNKPEVEVVKIEESDAEMKEADDGASELSNTENRPKKRRRIAVDTGIDVEADTSEGAFRGSSRWDEELKLHVHEIKVIRSNADVTRRF